MFNATALTNLAGSITLALGCIAASIFLHNTILARIMQAPMSFFDTTPIGRIVNRFAKDIDTVDNILPQNIRAMISTLFSVMIWASLVCVIVAAGRFMCRQNFEGIFGFTVGIYYSLACFAYREIFYYDFLLF